jgi:hypothetical protein
MYPTEGKMAGVSADVWMRGCAAPNYRGCQDGGIFGVVSNGLKGQCHEIFNFSFFFMNPFPPSPLRP